LAPFLDFECRFFPFLLMGSPLPISLRSSPFFSRPFCSLLWLLFAQVVYKRVVFVPPPDDLTTFVTIDRRSPFHSFPLLFIISPSHLSLPGRFSIVILLPFNLWCPVCAFLYGFLSLTPQCNPVFLFLFFFHSGSTVLSFIRSLGFSFKIPSFWVLFLVSSLSMLDFFPAAPGFLFSARYAPFPGLPWRCLPSPFSLFPH